MPRVVECASRGVGGLLLLLNFPLGLDIAVLAADEFSHADLLIHNASPHAVTDFHILGGMEQDIAVGDIQPGQSVLQRISLLHRSGLDCTANTIINGERGKVELNELFWRRERSVVITPDGRLSTKRVEQR